MVKGLDRFKEHFAGYADRYVLIGGTASSLSMEELGSEFRATKDLDLVLCAETLDREFAEVFWEFIWLWCGNSSIDLASSSVAKALPSAMPRARVGAGVMKTKLRLRPLSRLALLNFVACSCWIQTTAAADKSIVLATGNDLSGWRQPSGEWTVVNSVALDATDTTKFAVTAGEGVIFNGPKFKTVNLVTTAEFGDVEIHVEFCITKHSNSGVYVMGRYEVQIYDSFGVEKDQYPGIECGGIYSRWIDGKNVEGHSPLVNASKPPGEWQTFDITFRAPRFDAGGKKVANARFLEVRHNGKLVHKDVELTGPTRSALYSDEEAAGPLMLQGDHGPVAYRNIRITPSVHQ